MQEADLRKLIVGKIKEHTPMPRDGFEINDDDQLFDMGIIDSMAFLNIFLDIKEALGFDVDIMDVDPSSFSSVRGLVKLFSVKTDG